MNPYIADLSVSLSESGVYACVHVHMNALDCEWKVYNGHKKE